jgi:hypothetical protein
MKKGIQALALAIILAVTVTSCKKDSIAPTPVVESLIVETDAPPAALWANHDDSGFTYLVYIQKEDLAAKNSKGYSCAQYNNDCGDWYQFPTKKYFGIYQGKIYISKSKVTVIAIADDILKMQDDIDRKGNSMGNLCLGNGCPNPFQAFGTRIWHHN